MHNADKLRAADAALDLAMSVYDYTADFPREELYGLTSQMRRAAVSVGSNIYEGCSRQTDKGLVASLYVAHGETGELLFQLRFSACRKYGRSEFWRATRRELLGMRRMLERMIRYYERGAE
ncbi:MAG TPA: four helix bundle protein [Gemmatimonadaceae bacterium]|nr:four helix bundle protein [Gemmatimonadaceae bacterium]